MGRRPGLTLQFHPDFPHQGRRVIEAMADDGRYRSQFATGISNGGLTAHPGGDRWRWESRLFDGRYDEAGAEDRPLYGAWNRHLDPYGGSVRFGSAYVLLRPEVVERSTFCFPDSVFEPTDVDGTEVAAAAGRLGCDVRYHPGFRVASADVDPEYRGPEIAALARSLAAELTPDVIGDAARSGEHDPQQVKKVWHCLARFGRTTAS